MMKFQVLAHANLNLTPLKTAIKTSIMIFWTNIRKAPKRGVLALKVPGRRFTVLPGKRVILEIIGLFGGFYPFWYPGDESRVFDQKKLFTLQVWKYNLLQNFRKRLSGNSPEGQTDGTD